MAVNQPNSQLHATNSTNWSGAFLLSMWRDGDTQRFVIVNVYTQERHAFASLAHVQRFLLDKLTTLDRGLQHAGEEAC